MHLIKEQTQLGPTTFSAWIEAPMVARKLKAGQFIILRVDEEGERIPLTVAQTDPAEGTVRIIYQAVGYSTRLLAQKKAGDTIPDLLGPLGNPADLRAEGKVICVGGGVGAAVVYPEVRALHEKGVDVTVIIGARNKDLLVLEDELREISNTLYITTDDGSAGRKGLVTDVLKELLQQDTYDEVIAIGPPVMMKFVSALTAQFGVKTVVSMNPIMIDGTGMCGGCRILVGGKVKYACVDGPEFDGHQVDFDDLIARLRTYTEEEKQVSEAHACRLTGGLNGR